MTNGNGGFGQAHNFRGIFKEFAERYNRVNIGYAHTPFVGHVVFQHFSLEDHRRHHCPRRQSLNHRGKLLKQGNTHNSCQNIGTRIDKVNPDSRLDRAEVHCPGPQILSRTKARTVDDGLGTIDYKRFSACIFRKMVFIIVMLIWILVLLVLASGVGMGFRLGAICSAFSILGVFVATFFAHLIGRLIKPLVAHIIGSNPVLLWAIPTIVGFLIVYCVFMSVGFEVHRRVGVYYKYKAGDLKLALWERLNHRLGGCLGVLNGTAWLVIICFLFFNIGYVTAQVAPSDDEPKWIRLVNNVGHGMQSTGLDKAARGVGSISDSYYRTANFAGFLRQNPRVMGRLGEYPAFISFCERPEIQSLVQDGGLLQTWNGGAPIGQVLGNDQMQSILKNTNIIATVRSIVQTNMDDITNYLISGKSPKFDSEKIIGRWQFDVVPALGDLLEAQPKIRPNDLKAIRALWTTAFAQTTFVAGSDGQVFLKNVPDLKTTPPVTDTWTGQWSQDGANYDLTLTSNNRTKVAMAQTDGLRLTIKMGDNAFVFQRAY
jgi:Colicin V production protein